MQHKLIQNFFKSHIYQLTTYYICCISMPYNFFVFKIKLLHLSLMGRCSLLLWKSLSLNYFLEGVFQILCLWRILDLWEEIITMIAVDYYQFSDITLVGLTGVSPWQDRPIIRTWNKIRYKCFLQSLYWSFYLNFLSLLRY